MYCDFQALWRCLHNTPDSTANVAFRVLGKFGGSNRKMLPEAQKVIISFNRVFHITASFASFAEL